jgi:hypothetical protein
LAFLVIVFAYALAENLPIDEAAAPQSSLAFMFWVGVDRLPTDAALLAYQLQRLQGQGPSDRRALLGYGQNSS